jgi:hypothetical protein
LLVAMLSGFGGCRQPPVATGVPGHYLAEYAGDQDEFVKAG